MTSDFIFIKVIILGLVLSYVQPIYGQNPITKTDQTQQGDKKDDNTKEEGEVDRLMKQLKKKGEIVLGRCLEDVPCKSIKGQVINGQVVKGEVKEGEIVDRPQPVYPPIARAARASGSVVVQVIVDEEGRVIATR